MSRGAKDPVKKDRVGRSVPFSVGTADYEQAVGVVGVADRALRSRKRSVVLDRLATTAISVALIASVELLVRAEVVSPFIIPRPSHVASTVYVGFVDGVYLEHTLSTVGGALGGFAIGAVSAIVVAGALSAVERLERILFPFIVAFQLMPKVAIAPLVVLWLGFGQIAKTTLVTLICFFPIVMNALEGMRIRDHHQYDLLQSLGAGRLQVFRYLRIPGSLPYLFAGLHLGLIFAFLGAIVAEFVGSRAGLGHIMMIEKAHFNIPGVFAILIVLMAIGLALNSIMIFLKARATFWATDVSHSMSR